MGTECDADSGERQVLRLMQNDIDPWPKALATSYQSRCEDCCLGGRSLALRSHISVFIFSQSLMLSDARKPLEAISYETWSRKKEVKISLRPRKASLGAKSS